VSACEARHFTDEIDSSIRFSTVAWWSWPLIVIDTLALMALRSSFFAVRRRRFPGAA